MKNFNRKWYRNLNQSVFITAWSWILCLKTWGFNSKSRHKQKFVKAIFIRRHQGGSLLWSGRPGKKNRIRQFHLAAAGILETLQFWTLPNYFSHQDFVFLNKECFEQSPRQKTNLCIDLLRCWLNIEVINIILPHNKHFLLRCWSGRELWYVENF